MHIPQLDEIAETFRMAARKHFITSPLYSTLALRVAEDEELLKLAAQANPGQFPPYLFFPAVHSLVLNRPDSALADFFPTVSQKPVPDTDPYPAFREFALENREKIVRLIQSAHVNKSIIGRSASLRAMLVKVTRENAWDRVHLVDIGCGAGFNLLMDHWRITYQGVGEVGPADSPVRFSIEVHGDSAPPMDDTPEFCSRTGIDLDTFDLSDEADERWLLGFLFPDHLETFKTTQQALRVLRQNPLRVIKGDAAIELANVLRGLPGNDPVVIMSSMSIYHLKPPQRRAIFEAIQQASRIRPVARITLAMSAGVDAILTVSSDNRLEAIRVGEAEEDSSWIRWSEG